MKHVSLPIVFFSFLSITVSGLIAGLPAGTAHAGPSCVTDTCHSTIGKEKYVHGPVAMGECVVCHEKLGEHKFKKITSVKDLCAKCHDSKTGINNSHKSVARDYRECGNCHDAHQSPRPHMVLAKKK